MAATLGPVVMRIEVAGKSSHSSVRGRMSYRPGTTETVAAGAIDRGFVIHQALRRPVSDWAVNTFDPPNPDTSPSPPDPHSMSRPCSRTARWGDPNVTIAVDVATRAIPAAVLCPDGTRAVDAALLLAEMAVPHPMRPHWPRTLELSRASVPYERPATADGRLESAARPVIVPETIVVDRGKVFVSEAFLATCETLGVSV
ncbi:hypothetical protein [Embleya sp. MST-111070]|uniref:hypothetical protein n=1 Tax=Embleya sp. MST-111070 TaxID=3398231 RepID=UPI003F7396F2